MGENSAIQWTDHTFNPWIGCQRVSPGCVNCYAEHRDTFVRIQRRKGNELWGPRGFRHVTSDANWKKPVSWNRKAEKAGERKRVFCASLADVFEDRPELYAVRPRLWALIEQTPNLDWLLLTKRPENVRRMIPLVWDIDGLPANIWMGTSIEDQQRANERIPELVRIPARVRFLSCEPLVEEVTLRLNGVHWVIVGGESGEDIRDPDTKEIIGNTARPFNVVWANSIIEECRDAGVACFVKQLGARTIVPDLTHWRCGHDLLPDASGYRLRLRDDHGGDWNEWPEYLRVREWPQNTCLTLIGLP